MNWYLYVLKNYANFKGRARRKEYWMFFLFSILITIVLAIVDFFIGTFDPKTGYGLLSGIYSLAVLIPSLSVGARRLHDTGRSGWWQLLLFIPLIGSIVLIVFYCFDSQPHENRFGTNPKENSQAAIRL